MKKTNGATKADARLQQLLIALIKDYSTTDFRPFNSKLYRDVYKVGAAFASVLQQLGAIETKRGQIKLTDRFFTLRPSTLRKYMTKSTYEAVAKRKTVPVLAPEPTPVYNIEVLKAQIREEILQELLAKLK